MNDLISFEIADTGTGISKDKRDSIFNMYKTSIESDRSIVDSGGVGLGLSISYGLSYMMANHARKMNIESETNKGTTV